MKIEDIMGGVGNFCTERENKLAAGANGGGGGNASALESRFVSINSCQKAVSHVFCVLLF